jgi:transcriptional regulator with XRE-family HTH domain
VPGRESPREEGQRRAVRELWERCRELRDARLGYGLRQKDVARVLRWSPARVGRLERCELPNAAVVDLAAYGAVVGLHLGIQFYPAPGRIRDRAQLTLLARFRAVIAPGMWQARIEDPIGQAGDLRAFDMVLTRAGLRVRIGVEAFSRLRDVQAQTRRITLKQRDASMDRLVMLLLASKANRQAVQEAGAVLRDQFPLVTRQVLAALTSGRDPGANGIVFLVIPR